MPSKAVLLLSLVALAAAAGPYDDFAVGGNPHHLRRSMTLGSRGKEEGGADALRVAYDAVVGDHHLDLDLLREEHAVVVKCLGAVDSKEEMVVEVALPAGAPLPASLGTAQEGQMVHASAQLGCESEAGAPRSLVRRVVAWDVRTETDEEKGELAVLVLTTAHEPNQLRLFESLSLSIVPEQVAVLEELKSKSLPLPRKQDGGLSLESPEAYTVVPTGDFELVWNVPEVQYHDLTVYLCEIGSMDCTVSVATLLEGGDVRDGSARVTFDSSWSSMVPYYLYFKYDCGYTYCYHFYSEYFLVGGAETMRKLVPFDDDQVMPVLDISLLVQLTKFELEVEYGSVTRSDIQADLDFGVSFGFEWNDLHHTFNGPKIVYDSPLGVGFSVGSVEFELGLVLSAAPKATVQLDGQLTATFTYHRRFRITDESVHSEKSPPVTFEHEADLTGVSAFIYPEVDLFVGVETGSEKYGFQATAKVGLDVGVDWEGSCLELQAGPKVSCEADRLHGESTDELTSFKWQHLEDRGCLL